MDPRAEPRAVWVLNLDAEVELSAPARYRGPGPAMVARIAELRPRLSALLGPDPLVLGEGPLPPGPLVGRAWCPTPWALAQLARAGVQAPRAPALAVLAQVNHRRFSAALGQTLPGAAYVESREALDRALAERPRARWLLKRPFGFAGRGRRPVIAGRLTTADEAWIDATLSAGEGLQAEPWVERTHDCALHGALAEDGRLTLGSPTIQRVDPRGAWLGSERHPLPAAEDRALREELERTAAALHAAAYFGPFGIDAYGWRDEAGLHFNARSEINARYSMGWGIGMACT